MVSVEVLLLLSPLRVRNELVLALPPFSCPLFLLEASFEPPVLDLIGIATLLLRFFSPFAFGVRESV